MILNSIDKQLKLAEDGQITWQKDLTNPMPGEPVASIIKGDALLNPSCALIDSPVMADQDKDTVLKFIQEWLQRYVAEELAPLFKLKEDDIAEGAAREIAQKLHDALGILPRADLESLIAQMDEEKRATLRSKKIRFGPLIVFLPELNKPAAVKLRALLFTLWQDKELPAEKPNDGIVSFSVEGKDVDPDYYRAIGYPVYGPRSIRVDMLDRVICAVYDAANDGKFQAQHQMAEWLGSNIADLYAVLEAMGHTKIHDPADEEPKEKVAEEPKAEEVKKAELSQEERAKIEQEKKPDLATFRLKKGKAIDPKSAEAKNKNKFGDKKFSSDKKKFKPKNKKGKEKREQKERVYTAEAESKPEDSPFAILQQLKVSNKE